MPTEVRSPKTLIVAVVRAFNIAASQEMKAYDRMERRYGDDATFVDWKSARDERIRLGVELEGLRKQYE